MNFKQSFLMAIKSLRSNKMRSFLTMLGIIIGVASVIVLVSLVDGVSKDMTERFESMGSNLISVNIRGRGGNRAVSIDQLQALVDENPECLSSFSPSVNASITAKYESSSVDTTANGVNEQYVDIRNIELSSGRFISYIDTERLQKVSVIGSYIARELFESDTPLGQTIKLNGEKYTVIGVLEETQSSEAGTGDDIIYIPYTSATRLSDNARISSYSFSAADKDTSEEAIAKISALLFSVYGSASSYSVFSQSSMLESLNEMTSTMSMVLVGIAGISLLVGGIGIMNIMLVSVIERTREIGIRKSLGAKRRQIMSQFVIEAITTSSVGGVIGIIAGLALAYAAGAIMSMTVAPSFNAVMLAFSVSVMIGVTFGYFPASKASKLNPIDALKHD